MPPKGSGRGKKVAGAKVLANNHGVETEKPSDTDVKDSTENSNQTENSRKITRKGKQVKPVAKKPNGNGLQVDDIEMDEADIPLKTEKQKHEEEEIVENNSKVTNPAPKRGKKKTVVKAKEQDVIPENMEDDNGVQKEKVEEDFDLPSKNLKRKGTKTEVADSNPEETFVVSKKSKKEKNQAVKEPEPEESNPVSNAEDLNSTFVIDEKPKERNVKAETKPLTKSDTKPIEASVSRKLVAQKTAKLAANSPRVTRSRGIGTALKRPLPIQKAEPIKRKAKADTKPMKANTQSDKNVIEESSELLNQNLQPTVAIKRNENLDQKALEAVKGDSKTKGKQAKNEVPQKKASKKEQDVADLDFSNNSTTTEGESWNFKIASWNINGIRAWLEKGCMSYLFHEKPDILCVQETKCSLEKIPEDVQLEGYHTYWLAGDKDGYSGVGIISKQEPLSIKYGIDIKEHDTEGRVITAEYEKFYLVAAYVPNAGRGLIRLDYRTKWDKDFLDFLKNLDQKKPVILCGDLNVAHKEIDLANPKTNKKNAGFTKEEREGFSTLLAADFVDTFRHLYPEQKGAYTFWTYMMNARAKNVGWRLDYFIISKRFTNHLCDSVIRKEVLGSDHCPINLFLRI